ncbi:Calpain catalytic domain-containing protein [Mycena kentingensis (nom. inval.)]|nr:Calpain catalytic domain-containing protein [Mycena kentingensis (nom. inval.)]
MPSSFFKLFKPEAPLPDLGKLPSLSDDRASSYSDTIGLLASPELESVVEECKSSVARIAKQCRARNMRFRCAASRALLAFLTRRGNRDVEFDVENDQDRCLNGLVVTDVYNPSDVQRVSELFENPRFFVDEQHSNEIIQGQKCSNCWFISALAATSTVKSLVEKYCVARDEQVGVYGFVFWRDTRWVSVIVDDLLYTSIPKYEELSIAEKALFQNDKERYNASARKGNKTLFFAKSGSLGETWVPLVEKAYAKLHGDWGSLYSGFASEGIEDLTGGVSSFIQCKDILDKEAFWSEELLKSNHDRLFACSFQGLNPTRSGNFNATVSGLWGNHSYAVLRTLEYGGKRFLVLRNPCGQAEWNGPWSDGSKVCISIQWLITSLGLGAELSKDWTPEWMGALPALGHVFGDPGKFIMEYKDFLLCFEQLDRTRLFDSSWTVRSEVVRVSHPRPFPDSGLGYGDVCFTFTLSQTTTAIIVLSQLDVRYFKGICSPCYWTFDFVLYRRGDKYPLDMSPHSRYTSRSVSLEFGELEAGDYIVHCRLDKVPFSDKANADEWSQSKLSRVITQRAESESVATNVDVDWQEKNIAIPLRVLAGQDLSDLGRKADAHKEEKKRAAAEDAVPDSAASDASTDTKVNEPVDLPGISTTITTITTVRTPVKITTNTKEVVLFGRGPPKDADGDEDATSDDSDASSSRSSSPRSTPKPPPPDNAAPFLGLKVYTPRSVDVEIKAQLRHDLRTSFLGLNGADWKTFAL